MRRRGGGDKAGGLERLLNWKPREKTAEHTGYTGRPTHTHTQANTQVQTVIFRVQGQEERADGAAC